MSRRKRGFTAQEKTEVVEVLQCVADVLFNNLHGMIELHSSAANARMLLTAVRAVWKVKYRISVAPTEPDDSPPTAEPDERQRRLLEVLRELDADRMWRC